MNKNDYFLTIVCENLFSVSYSLKNLYNQDKKSNQLEIDNENETT